MFLLLPALRLALGAETFGDQAFYLGDPHVHTGISQDGGSDDLGDCKSGTCGNLADVFADAKAGGLEWIAVSDHVNGTPKPAADEDEFNDFLAELLAANVDGSFVTVPSGEVWFELPSGADLGHKNVMMFGDDTALASLTMSDLSPTGADNATVVSCEAIADWMDDLGGSFGNALLIPHHTAASRPMATDFDCHSEDYELAVEVYSGHGNSLDASATYDPIWSTFSSTGAVHYALDPDGLGLKMGFLAGSDSHDTRPGDVCVTDSMHPVHPYGGGYTVAVLDAGETFTRQALYEAIKERRTLATTGILVPLNIAWESGSASLGGLGDTLALPTGQDLDVTVQIANAWEGYVDLVELVTPDGALEFDVDGDGAWRVTLPAADVHGWAYVQVQLDGDAYFRSSCADGGADGTEFVWSSPSWIEDGPTDLDADGEAFLDGDCDDGDASVHTGGTEVWYDDVDQNCDGNDDDQDGDGVVLDVDCDDLDATAFPNAPEVVGDGVDQDCDGRDGVPVMRSSLHRSWTTRWK